MITTERGDRTKFICNICSQENDVFVGSLTREDATCSGCGSTVRMRSMVQILTAELFGKSMTIDEISPPGQIFSESA